MLGFFKGKTKEKVICSPCVGNVTPLTEVPDPTFSEKILGDGFAVIPSEGKIFAPADGEITMVFDTLHAITMTTAAGTELLNIISPVVVCNTDDYSKISLLKEGGVSPDEAVLKVE